MTNDARSEISLHVNGTTHRLTVDNRRTLLDALREDTRHIGSKKDMTSASAVRARCR